MKNRRKKYNHSILQCSVMTNIADIINNKYLLNKNYDITIIRR